MSIAPYVGAPAFATPAPVPTSRSLEPRLYRFTVDQYHQLAELDVFAPDDRLELLDGLILQMPPPGPAHAYSVEVTSKRLSHACPAGWTVRSQQPVTLKSSELVPDNSIARGTDQDYRRRHPSPSDIGLLVEVSDSSLDYDQTEKESVYAESEIARYWIIDLVHRQIEVYTEPRPASGSTPASYAHREVYSEDQTVPLILDGQTIVEIAVSELLP